LINAGGVVDVYQRIHGGTQVDIDAGVAAIAARLKSVLTEADSRGISPEKVAQERAEKLISVPKNDSVSTVAA